MYFYIFIHIYIYMAVIYGYIRMISPGVFFSMFDADQIYRSPRPRTRCGGAWM